MMKPIKQQIKEKTDNFNDNGKVKHLFEIIQYCLQMLPDLETASLGINDETIDQLVSSIKFILLVKKESLNNTNSIKTNEFNKIQQENNKLEKQITIKKQNVNIEQSSNQNLKEIDQILTNIIKLKNEIDIPEDISLSVIVNKFKHLSSLSVTIPELKSSQDKCKSEIKKFNRNLKKVIAQKKEIENLLRSKINEV